MRADFIDTNVILYLLSGETEKATISERLLGQGGTISVQVLNETLVNCRRKAGMDWTEAGEFLAGIRRLTEVVDVTARSHDLGRAVGERYGLSVFDAMLVGAALEAGCSTFWSEDMQDGLRIADLLVIRDPYAEIGTS